jgi:hypothetical protein
MHAQDPNRDREAPVHTRHHTSGPSPLKPENAGFQPQTAFPVAMLQKGHDCAGVAAALRRSKRATA